VNHHPSLLTVLYRR